MIFTYILLVFLAFILVGLYLYLKFCRWGRLLSKIPGNPEWPIVGHAFELASMTPESAFRLLRYWTKKYGRIYKMRMFKIAAVNISHPDDIEVIYSSIAHIGKEIPYHMFNNWLCDGLLISNGEKWKQRRKMLTPAFHFNILNRYLVTFNEQAQQLVERVQKEVGNDRTCILPLLINTTLDVMLETSLGASSVKQYEHLKEKYSQTLLEMGDLLRTRYFTGIYHAECIYNLSPLSRKENKHLKVLHEFTRTVINDRKQYRETHAVRKFDDEDDECKLYGSKQRLAMLDLLLENEKDGKIDMDGIRGEVDTFLLEGHDTTASALSFMFMRIANETEVQNKIYEELQQIFGKSDRPTTTNDLNKMKYLECCVKESLRLYPSVFAMARYIHQDVELGGYTVPANTIVHTHIYDLHHNPEIYPDPERFIPERFLPEVSATRHPYAYIPFSAGPRNCIGQKFAMMEMKTLVAGVLRRYHLEPITKTEDVVLLLDLVLKPKEPMFVRFIQRKNNS